MFFTYVYGIEHFHILLLLANKYPNYVPIQSQLITIYMNQKKYAQAEELAKKYPNHAPIQSQLITIYINQNKYMLPIILRLQEYHSVLQ